MCAKLEKRLRGADREVQKDKLMKTTLHSIADEYLCLPIDPVMAEDGRIYQRSAIMEWLGRNRQSPIT